jgi:hypothetical protein
MSLVRLISDSIIAVLLEAVPYFGDGKMRKKREERVTPER